jgi:RimJ/RimL family protein N-acetyltransferase
MTRIRSVAERLTDALPSRRGDQVTIRPAYPRDAALLYRWRSEPSVRKYQPLSHLSLAQLRAELASQNHDNLYRARGDKFQWIIQMPDAAGWITLVVANWDHGLAEIGYALGTIHQRRGIMAQALEGLLSDLFERTRLRRIEARCAVENHASIRVLDRLGFRREGLLRHFFMLRGEPVDNYLYALLREDWVEVRGPAPPAGTASADRAPVEDRPRSDRRRSEQLSSERLPEKQPSE